MNRWLGRLLVLALLLPAAAEAEVCELEPPRPKVSARERELRETIRMRKSYGFRRDRAYVRRVNADPAARRRAGEGRPPLTRREHRYVVARDRLTEGRSFERLVAYVDRHRDDFGGVSIEDDWPAGAYVRVPVVRDAARHRPAVARFGIRFRMPRTRWSRGELLRVQNRLDRDDEMLARGGIHVISTGFGAGDRLTLEVATSRADVRSFVRGRYGDGVRLVVVGATPTFLDCRRPERYEAEPDGRTLKVHWTDSGSITPRHVEVIETPDTVYLGAVAETSYFETLDARPYTLTVTLAEPLGARAVKTIEYGHDVRPGSPS